MSETCKACGKTLAMPISGGTYDHTKFCTGYHVVEIPLTMSPIMGFTPVYATLIEQDRDAIRMIVREELERSAVEGERRLNEIFKQPVEKHDGRLDGNVEAYVAYQNVYAGTDGAGKPRYVRGACIFGYDVEMPLLAKQALSLRDWLIQESDELEQLAKEQEDAL